MFIYADNASTTKMSPSAIEAMLPYFDRSYGNPSSLHNLGQEAMEDLVKARERIAQCLGCHSKEVYFTSGGSESDNQAIISAARIGSKCNKRHIISAVFEHHAVLNTLNKLKLDGFEIELLPVGETGRISPQQVEDAIRQDTCLVTIMYANNEIGSIQPVGDIGRICREKSIFFHTDAVQAAGHIPIDFNKQYIDMLSLSAHKFHGPKGIGALIVKQGIPLVNLIEGGAQERGRRGGTENVPAIMGMAAALEESCKHMKENSWKISEKRDRLIEALAQIPHSVLNGDRFERLPGNINFCFEGIEGESLLLLLDAKGICASSGSACASGALDPSHVLLALGRQQEIAQGALRLSLSADNTIEEIEYMVKTIPQVINDLRSRSSRWEDKMSGKVPFYL